MRRSCAGASGLLENMYVFLSEIMYLIVLYTRVFIEVYGVVIPE